ncbi:Heat shock protein HslJ [Maribacter dokdonensis]|uniref:META domain-containing protein n=1 Tax=Maribacter dokdonensis TaxID=320912 RepID=UPI001B191FF3|nr:META domain-containing protein [Maribacter dokdonensis]CAG2532805.1 Heat shock protein HslJ [Maribacter dokdonensis]
MKSAVTLVFVLFLTSLFPSCSNEDDAQVSEQLTGTWLVLGYQNDGSTSLDTPPDGTEEITISFDGSAFNGNTGRNNFSGSYSIENDFLSFPSINSTEVAESEWGTRFFNALNEAYNSTSQEYLLKFDIVQGQLIIEYQTGNTLVLRKI